MLASGFYNMDCMDAMREFPDNFFELAIVDPPYGDGGGSGLVTSDSENDLTGIATIPRGGGTGSRSTTSGGHLTNGLRKGQSPPNWWNLGGEVRKKIIAWDVAPKQEYFEELFRISQNQIIWGGQLLQTPTKPMFSDMAQN